MRKTISIIILVLCFFNLSSCIKQDKQKTTFLSADSIIVETIVEPNKSKLELYLDSLGFVEVSKGCPDIRIDLKYATEDNFTKKILYKDLSIAYLHPLGIEKLKAAQALLKKDYPHLSLLVYDAARPLSVQQEMYDAVKDTKYKAYVADPSRTSLHNYGLAIDITICDSLGNSLDMGTKFDYFGKLAGILNEELFIQQNLLNREQVNNRILLRSIMQKIGFSPIRGEWWHFNAVSLSEAKNRYTLIK